MAKEGSFGGDTMFTKDDDGLWTKWKLPEGVKNFAKVADCTAIGRYKELVGTKNARCPCGLRGQRRKQLPPSGPLLQHGKRVKI